MKEHEIINPGGWPRPRGYANAIAATGRVITVAGQVGWNPLTERVETADFVEQVRTALRNMNQVLAAAGAAAADLVRMTWYITDRDAYVRNARLIGEVYRAECGRHFPAMTVVIVAGLLEPGAQVEIEATAVKPA